MRLDISAPDIFDLRDRVVVITGGMGKLGQRYMNALLDRGAKVALLDKTIHHDSFDEQATNDKLWIGADVTDYESLYHALSEIQSHWGVPYALINNAAIDTTPAESTMPFEVCSEATWDEVMDVNVKGPFLCSQVFGNEMAKAGRGSIVNISSIYGMVSPDQRIYPEGFCKPIYYSASKSALFNMTRYLATYWGKKGVRVNTLTLGGVFNNQNEEFVKRYVDRVPMGRMANEMEYSGAVVFLVSDASSYMTGSNLVIDGGLTAW